jgi:hypothetical protein
VVVEDCAADEPLVELPCMGCGRLQYVPRPGAMEGLPSRPPRLVAPRPHRRSPPPLRRIAPTVRRDEERLSDLRTLARVSEIAWYAPASSPAQPEPPPSTRALADSERSFERALFASRRRRRVVLALCALATAGAVALMTAHRARHTRATPPPLEAPR